VILAFAVLGLVFGVGPHSRFAWSQGGESEIVILSSGSMYGELAPCG
jgi:hypothetical protein